MNTIINRNKLFIGILVFLLFINIFVWFDLKLFYVRAALTFIFLITIPGLLVILMLKIRKIGFWEYLVYTIGLSVAFIMFAGLAVNWTLPFLGITDRPLSLYSILISFDIFLLIFMFIAFKRNSDLKFELKFQKLDTINRIFFITPLIFPVLSILGALILNNFGPNYLTMIMLGGIAVCIFMLIPFRNKLNENIYPWVILMISVSLLLMFSLRGGYVSGHDILAEFRVFQLTKENFNWDMSNLHNAYNACLSITILPTILSLFLKINDQFIFKLIIPLIFSITPIVIYLFLKRYVKSSFIFIAIFFFISQRTFFIEMLMEGRQSIALLFFTLTLLILFNKNINIVFKNYLFLIFAFSMIISHYSTSYIALALFISTYLICFVFRKTEDKRPFSKIYEKFNLKEKGRKINERKYYLSGILVLLLVIFAFFWNAQLTESSNNLVDALSMTVKNINKIFREDVRQQGVTLTSNFNIFYKPEDPAPLLKDYTTEITVKYNNDLYTNFYSSDDYKDYNAKIIYPKTLPLKINQNLTSKIYLFSEIIKKSVKVFIIIGIFYLFFFKFKKKEIDTEYTILCLICISFLGMMVFLPIISTEYSIERFYQQILVILLIPLLFGGLIIFKFTRKNLRVILILLVFLFFFLFHSGFIPQFIGGTDADPYLNNFGGLYDKFYTHKTEIESVEWVSNNINKGNLIYADVYARRKLLSFGSFEYPIIEDILPSVINKRSYVYLDYRNDIKKKASKQYRKTSVSGGVDLDYNFPTEFLNKNKNKIYNNGGSEIFK